MRKVEVHPEVYEELEQARAWYENQVDNLGVDFLDMVEIAIATIQKSPNTWSIYQEGLRRFLIHRFPFEIIYQHDSNKIQIIAVAHLKRKPGYWKERKFK